MSRSDLFLALAAATLPKPGESLDQHADRLGRALRAIEMGTNFAGSPVAPPASSPHDPLVNGEGRTTGRESELDRVMREGVL